MKKVCIFLFAFIYIIQLYGQSPLNRKTDFTMADTLRGMLSPLRSCYDVTYYNLDLKVDPDSQFISGFNDIHFKVIDDFHEFQIDLFDNMKIEKIMYKEKELNFKRMYHAVFVDFEEELKEETLEWIRIYYSGKPIVAKRPPWDGGFTWDKDKNGNHWVGVSCEGIGASLWWPNKDHLSDEPDSMTVTCAIPADLSFVGNGNFVGDEVVKDGWKTSSWHIGYPINNYNVTLNIGDYRHIHDEYTSDNQVLSLDYYVMPYSVEKAKDHFNQVKPMLVCFEHYFGKYPFWKDGYALVETPYLGMEHQGAIAYGNKYKTGYAGIDFSRIGLDFDYIIIHETGHEYWGNNVSARDIADLWIHEGFCTYSESIYVECMHGYEIALKYINAKKRSVENKRPMIGIYNVNKEGDGDMYNKGMLFLNSVRHILNNDELWFYMLKDMQTNTFRLKTTSTKEILDYFNEKTGRDWTKIFKQYLEYPDIPVLVYDMRKDKKDYEIRMKWETDVEDFKMPVRVSTSKKTMEWKEIGNDWMTFSFKGKEKHFNIDEDTVYFELNEM